MSDTGETRHVVGLDLSLTGTGIAWPGGCEVITSKLRGCERLAAIRTAIANRVCPTTLPRLIAIEDYAYSRGDAHAHSIGELGGVVRMWLWQEHIPYFTVVPSAVKKFATGKGNANKTAMAIAASKAGYDGPEDDNCVDAWWLRQMGLWHLGCADVSATAYREATALPIVVRDLLAVS